MTKNLDSKSHNHIYYDESPDRPVVRQCRDLSCSVWRSQVERRGCGGLEPHERHMFRGIGGVFSCPGISTIDAILGTYVTNPED